MPTGPGALVWAASADCAGGSGARVQAILPGRAPAAALAPASPDVPSGVLATAAASEGRIAIAGADPRRRGSLLVVQGVAGGRFSPLLKGARPLGTAAMCTAYLGDLAMLTPLAGRHLGIRVERWSGGGLGSPRTIATRHSGIPSSLTVTMDYRSDTLAAWAQNGSIWTSELPQHGSARPAVRLGPAGSEPHIAALLSDDDRGIVMWMDRSAGTTSVWFDFSAPGPHFGRPLLLDRFEAPSTPPQPAGPAQLIRLSSEGVMAAWASIEAGRWVLRTAAVDQRGLGTVGTIAALSGDLLLYALAPGPAGEALALIGEPRTWPSSDTAALPGQSGTWQAGSIELFAARGTESAGHASFSAPEALGEAAAPTGESIAVEPGTGRAVAAWRGDGGRIFYSLRDAP